jgi:hypothetical protein
LICEDRGGTLVVVVGWCWRVFTVEREETGHVERDR